MSALSRVRAAAALAVASAAACDRSVPPGSLPARSAPATAPSAIVVATEPKPRVEAGPADAPQTSACASDESCGFDGDESACRVGGQRPYPRDPERGMFCACREGRCELVVVGPFPCTSWRDCSWTETPHLRPVPSKEKRRPFPRPVRPCRDGEVDSPCADRDGGGKVCRIEAWKC